ncbi:hypothetical protein L6J37_05225 [Photobacterium sp. WH77]|nr:MULTISPECIES: hypothetical protein [Photobacterium]MCG2836262.1 hypothetical protein [Photobacterium sp. WH77]MCG2844111.1 hypothetical protein [Photobacterium sp. WH80]
MAQQSEFVITDGHPSDMTAGNKVALALLIGSNSRHKITMIILFVEQCGW